ncbi:transposase [Gracilimonas sp.]|uniref:transposase n=1 Tax=Gracilimonas sp. TaxID=1974203 RepID=UPI0037507C0A
MHFRDQIKYNLYAYCIMPNHVHLVFQHLSNSTKETKDVYPVTDILASLKKYTARLCNQKLSRTGNPFWHPESYDRVVRDSSELHRVIHYTLYNPVKAGLITNWKEWPNSYCKNEFRDLF